MTSPVPHVLYGLVLVLPPLSVLLALPMILGWVRPNSWYGLRTRKTRSSRYLWYRANRLGGVYMVVATLVSIAAWGALAGSDLRDGLRLPIYLGIFFFFQCVGFAVLLVKVQKM